MKKIKMPKIKAVAIKIKPVKALKISAKKVSLPKTMKAKKIKTVMEEFKRGELHSGSKKGPKVKSRKQAVAIALNSARRLKK